MHTYFPVLSTQMKLLFSLLCIGFLAQKTRLVDQTVAKNLSVLIARLILPCMLCSIIGSVSISQVTDGLRIFFATAILYSLSVLLAKKLSSFSSLQEPERSMQVLLQCYGNSGYIGIPLLLSIFPEYAGIVAAAYTLVDSFFYWFIGPFLVGSNTPSFKKLLSPITISLFLGVAVLFLPFPLADTVFWTAISDLGSTCKYFASLYIGMNLALTTKVSLTHSFHAITAAPIKLLLLPLLAYLLFCKTGFLTGPLAPMFLLLCATPSGMSLPIVATIAGIEDPEYLSVGVTLSTLLCFITIPLLLSILPLSL